MEKGADQRARLKATLAAKERRHAADPKRNQMREAVANQVKVYAPPSLRISAIPRGTRVMKTR